MTSRAAPSLQDLWNDAERRFYELTKKTLRISPPKSLDDVRREIDNVQAQDDSSDRDKKRKAKDAALNAMYCIKLLGGVAAQGAAMAFGPADLCFNAASILMEVPQKVHEFRETISGLFDEVSIFLSQFRIYQRVEQFATIDPDLNDTIHKLMISFVSICALAVSYQAGGKWKRFKMMSKKVLLDDDSGVQKELDGFKALVQRQSQVRDTLTLEHVLKNEKDLASLLNSACETGKQLAELGKGMDVLVSGETNRKLEQITQEQLKKLRDGLPVSDSTAKASKTLYNEHWTDSVANTGAWLKTIDLYQEWFDRESDANPVLLLTGDANAGKSFLMSVIAHNLQAKYADNTKSTTRTFVLYHFFPKRTEDPISNTEAPRTGERNPRPVNAANSRAAEMSRPVETALKILAYQIAEQDAAYAKMVVALCESEGKSYFKDATTTDLWKTLKFMHSKRGQTYFILLDGFDQLPEDSAKQLLKILVDLSKLAGTDRSQVRILATSQAKLFEENKALGFSTIDVEQHNSDDISRYIDLELKRRDLLQGRDPETIKIKTDITEQLPGVANGSFYKVQNALDQIDSIVQADGTSEDIQNILDRAGQDPSAIAKTVIKDLNQSLTAREIDEVNEILIWAVYGRSYLTVEKFQAALFSYFRTAALQPLKQKLKGKYSKIFTVENAFVRVDDEVRDLVITSQRRSRSEEEKPKISATITITRGDIKTVQNFLWELTENAMREKFPFDLTQAVTDSKGTIQVNEVDANLRMIRQTFKVLNDEVDDRTKAIIPYMLEQLPIHLERLRVITSTDPLSTSEISAIGRDLYALFVDGEIIEKFWELSSTLPVSWFEAYQSLKFVIRWLNQPEAQTYLGKKDKEWLKDINKDNSPIRALTRSIILMIANRWLRTRDVPVGDCWFWIRFYLAMPQEFDIDAWASLDDDVNDIVIPEVNNDEADDNAAENEDANDSDTNENADEQEDKEDDEDDEQDQQEEEDEDEEEEEEEDQDDTTKPGGGELVAAIEGEGDSTSHLETVEDATQVVDQQEADQNQAVENGNSTENQEGVAVDELQKTDQAVTGDEPVDDSGAGGMAAEGNEANETEAEDTPEDNASLVDIYNEDVGEVAETIAKASKWVQKHLEVGEPDALFLERLGETYLWMLMYSEALDCFDQSLEQESDNYRSVRGRAMALGELEKYQDAITAMDEAIKLLTDLGYLAEFEKEKLRDSYVSKAKWHEQLDQPKEAIQCYHTAIEVKDQDDDIFAQLLMLLLKTERGEELRTLCIDLSSKKSTDDDNLTQLSTTLRAVAENTAYQYLPALFLFTRGTPVFRLVVESLDKLIDVAKETKVEDETREAENMVRLATLLLWRGIAMYRYEQEKDRNLEKALALWGDCANLKDPSGQYEMIDIQAHAIRLINSYHFQQAKTSRNPRSHVDKMEQLVEGRQKYGITEQYSRSYLGCYYSQVGETGKAKDLFMSRMKQALDLLSDDIEENDSRAYYELADVLMHFGDNLNSLSAWSMLGPTDAGLDESPEPEEPHLSRRTTTNSTLNADADGIPILKTPSKQDSDTSTPALTNGNTELSSEGPVASPPTPAASTPEAEEHVRPGPLCNFCDGSCGKNWSYADDFYCCKVCPDVQLCLNCLTMLKNGTLKRFVCDAEHSWLHVPPWNDAEYSKGMVTVGGEFTDEARVGGTKVSVTEWLKSIAEDWGIEFRPAIQPIDEVNGTSPKDGKSQNKKKKGKKGKKGKKKDGGSTGGAGLGLTIDTAMVKDTRKRLDEILTPIEPPPNDIFEHHKG